MAALAAKKMSVKALICRIRNVGNTKDDVTFEQLQEWFC